MERVNSEKAVQWSIVNSVAVSDMADQQIIIHRKGS